jgi:uncharacterized protein YvpB
MRKIISVPYVRQTNGYFCGPAVIEMLLGFSGVKATQKELAKTGKTKSYRAKVPGTMHNGLIKIARKYGFYCYVHESSSLHLLKHFIIDGYPVVVNYTNPSNNEGHYSVVTGFDEKDIIMNDPWEGENFKIKKEEFLKRWLDKELNTKRWMLVLSKKKFEIGKQYFPK